MADLTGMMLAAAGQKRKSGSYIAVGGSTTPFFHLLDHTIPGSLSIADTFTAAGNIGAVIFTKSGKFILASGAGNGNIVVLNHETKGSVSLTSTFSSFGTDNIAISSDDEFVACRRSNGVELLSLDGSGTLSSVTSFALNNGSGVAFSPDDQYIATLEHVDIGERPILKILERPTPTTLNLISSTNLKGVRFGFSVSYSLDGQYIICGHDRSGSFLEGLTLVDVSNPVLPSISDDLETGRTNKAVFSSDSNYIAVAHSGDPQFRLVDHTTPGTIVSSDTEQFFTLRTTTPINADRAEGVAYSPDDKYIAVGIVHTSGLATQDSVFLFEQSGSIVSLVDQITTSGRTAFSISFSPD